MMWGLGTNLYNWLQWLASSRLQTETQYDHCLGSRPHISSRHMSFQINCMPGWTGRGGGELLPLNTGGNVQSRLQWSSELFPQLGNAPSLVLLESLQVIPASRNARSLSTDDSKAFAL